MAAGEAPFGEYTIISESVAYIGWLDMEEKMISLWFRVGRTRQKREDKNGNGIAEMKETQIRE